MANYEKLMAEVSELIESGKNKGQIEGYLKYAHDMSTAEAKAFSAKAFEENGYSPNMYGRADHVETVKYLRENYGKIDKSDLIKGMCEVNGKTYKTNQHAYNYVSMMVEWAKQELEANR